MATSREIMERLHCKVADSFHRRLDQDEEDNIPTDAATLSAMIKFLKDNEITADPASKEDMQELRDKLANQRKNNILQLAKSDVRNVAEG